MDYFLLLFKQNVELVKISTPYFHIIAFAILPSMLSISLNEFVMGIMQSRLVVIWAIIATPINIFLGFALLFGKFGLPQIGIAGVALASLITYWGMFLVLIWYFYNHQKFSGFYLFKFKKIFNQEFYNYLYQIFDLGWPICLQLGAIAFSFSFLTYMIGWLGKDALAAYQVASQCVGLVIMIPYGIAQASSVLVAKAFGEKSNLTRAGFAGVILAVTVVSLFSFVYWLFPKNIIAIYLNLKDSNNAAIIALAVWLLILNGVIQIIDSVGIVITGALRGLHDTKIPMMINIAISWLFNIPIGYIFGFIFHFGAVGINFSFLLGSIILSIILCRRYKGLTEYLNP